MVPCLKVPGTCKSMMSPRPVIEAKSAKVKKNENKNKERHPCESPVTPVGELMSNTRVSDYTRTREVRLVYHHDVQP